ncbi:MULTISPECIES: sodium ion-translocating decarboxylase subunit beta [Fusobacterium]|uniref:Glutaconyl-CoA decarboxylase subunit beta n=1 Tax=Fusobacterium nucleatum subsp. polymorphum TaxID=76857 RepID=A0A2C6APC1_FUSNP|nr:MULTISPECIES: sodium ion-translocating decarboxylase subunit beta [Fusobacterium]EUB21995.1 glutaconyl-CoA decarboxylase subunit beta [Fusobacterium sp. CM22]PGH20459.1 glutaconyl-CoA decarboxylase subunit beta [Fusobacterium polymorphum]PHI03979.1 glutaconyl-CoA decarboxylase subunit beta [Fusobacterium polymorphum]PHI16394.1 glutaconyl-CoA decarboxylase subunit beta [Fusobacterium polymorphum]WCB32509.1 sodium ion-translocating decarboxylase subunit beta [Fusobacterium nucleatum]
MNFFNVIAELLEASGFAALTWQNIAMILVSFVLFYLAIVKKFEPLLLLPISFGMFLVNLPLAGLMDEGGVIHIMSYGVKSNLFPCLVFMGVGAMTDFSPLIANPISLILGAAAQLGIYVAFIFATQIGFTPAEAAAIGIIGGADGPTSIYIANNLAPHLLAPIAVAAYSYMALIPLIQPPIMKALTTKKERAVKMGQLRKVSKTEKIVFPIAVVLFCSLLLPSVAPLLGLLMLGNLFRESGVVQRLSDTAQNAMINIITIMLGLSVGAKADGATFLDISTIKIILMGLAAFCFSTVGGVLLGKLLYVITGGKINPLIGSAGVSAVPMAARVSQTVGAKENPTNFLLMHAMGPNVAGVIGSAVAAGFFMMIFKGTM